MKRLMLWGMMACGFLSHVMGQKISPVITLQDGRIVTPEYAFLDGDTCTFHIETDNKVYWEFALFEEESTAPTSKIRTDTESSSFILPVHNINGHNTKRFEIKGDSSVYFKGIIYAIENKKRTDSITVLFNLLPARPEIIKASLTYTDFDWEHDDFNSEAVLHIVIPTARGESYSLWTGEAFCFNFPAHYFFRYGYNPKVYEEDGNTILECNNAEWGEFYIVSAHNTYGTVYGTDTLFTTDYIPDSKILARLEEIEKNLSSVPTLTEGNDIRILNAGHHIKIEGDQSLVREISIYNHTGILIKNQHGGEDMDISDLPQGIYIVTCRTEDNRLLTKKIMKS